MYVNDRLTNRNNPSEKHSSVIYGLSMSPSVINISMDLQMDKTRQKKIICFISLVYPSVKITYHQQNTICNFIGA